MVAVDSGSVGSDESYDGVATGDGTGAGYGVYVGEVVSGSSVGVVSDASPDSAVRSV